MNGDESAPASSATTPALLAGVPGVAGATLATCGAACAGACASPFLGFIGLSSSGAAVLSWAGWLRPLFFLVSAVSVGIAFHRVYRRGPGHPGRSSRFIDSRGFVWLMAVVTLALFALPPGSALLQAAPHAPCPRPCSKADCPARTNPRNPP
jgi:hypothetical protein